MPSDPRPLTRPARSSGPFPQLPIELRPDRSLLTYYVVSSFALGPFFPFLLVPMYFRFHTMRYHIDHEGIRMSWGLLFRREITLTYARIQDIHLSSNFVERWLGLGRIQVQTASGSASAEMTIEGLRDFEAIRDFLYGRMRGARELGPENSDPEDAGRGDAPLAELTATLHAVAAEVRALRVDMGRRSGEASDA
jgi:membrane protein YdbS with pleckstrin-like domain